MYEIRSDTCGSEITWPQTGMYGRVGFADSPRPWLMIVRSCAAVSEVAPRQRRDVRRDASASLHAVALGAGERDEVVRAGGDVRVDGRRRRDGRRRAAAPVV